MTSTPNHNKSQIATLWHPTPKCKYTLSIQHCCVLLIIVILPLLYGTSFLATAHNVSFGILMYVVEAELCYLLSVLISQSGRLFSAADVAAPLHNPLPVTLLVRTPASSRLRSELLSGSTHLRIWKTLRCTTRNHVTPNYCHWKMYDNEHHSELIASLMLAPSDTDRSTITLHFPVLPFGIILKLLVITAFYSSGANGPVRRPSPHSQTKYSSTTFRCSSADFIFFLVGLHGEPYSKPSLKPQQIQSVM